MILAFPPHIYNYRAELEMGDKRRANAFSLFAERLSKLRDLTERIPGQSSSSLAHVIEFGRCTFIQVQKRWTFVFRGAHCSRLLMLVVAERRVIP